MKCAKTLNDESVEVLLSFQSPIRALFSGARLAAESGVDKNASSSELRPLVMSKLWKISIVSAENNCKI